MCEITETEFGQIEYSIKGKGKPVLFFHGGHSNCKEVVFQKGWDLSSYMLITASRPGYGNTPLNQNITALQTAKLINRLVENLQINEKVIVVGISAGGLSAIEFAALFPDKTCNLILISAVTKKWLNENDDLYKRGIKMFSAKREKMSWKLFRTFFTLFPATMTKLLFKELSTIEKPEITSEEIKEIRDMTFQQASGSGFVTDLNQTSIVATIASITCPTLILHSQNDKSVPDEMASYAGRHIKHSILKTYNNKWGHLLWVGEDSIYPIKDLNEFLKENGC